MAILTINIGSSSLKASLFDVDGTRQDINEPIPRTAGQEALLNAFQTIVKTFQHQSLTVIGHRLVHGGDMADAARLITVEERKRLNEIVSLAPLHLPNSLNVIDLCANAFAGVPQVACFDNAFHATLPEIAYRLPIPKQFHLRRYGFHGLSYAYIAKQLPDLIGELSKRNVIIAHLGSGASLCMLQDLKSVDTTMGYSPAGGIPMATRSGDMDPGVMLALSKLVDHDELSRITYQEMGLKALSDGISADVKTLLASDEASASFAIAYYAQAVRGAIGALAAKYGGVDALVFTGGVGEHSDEMRAAICDGLQCLEVRLSYEQNHEHATFIHEASSKPVLVIPCDEAREMASLCEAILSK